MSRSSGYRYSNGKGKLVNTQTANYTLTPEDNGGIVVMNSASALTVTVAQTLTGEYDCIIVQGGAGQVTVSPSGTTINSNLDQLKTRIQNDCLYLKGTPTLVSSVPTGDTFNLWGVRLAPRVTSVTSGSTPTPNIDSIDLYSMTALATNPTFGAPIGTPSNGQLLTLAIRDDGTPRTLAYNVIYSATAIALPTLTVAGQTLYIHLRYNSFTSKYEVTGVTSSSGGGTPGGSNTQVQYNNSGAFGANANFTYDTSTNRLLVKAVNASDQPFRIQLAASPSGDALDVYDSAGTTKLAAITKDGYLSVTPGPVSVPVLSAIGSPAVGWTLTSTYSTFYAGHDIFGVQNGAIQAGNGEQFQWNSNSSAFQSAADTGLKRAAPKVVGITDGSTGGGSLQSVPLSPTALAANTDNYNPGTALWIRLSASGAVNLTGIVAGQDGELRHLINVGANTITLKHQVTSTAANQFFSTTGADLSLAANKIAIIMYDSATARWRVSLLP